MRGDRLRRIREQLGLSQEELAEQLKIGHRQIWRYEHNASNASSEVVIKVAQALGVSADYLLGLSDDPTPCFGESSLSVIERQFIAAWRRKDYLEALRLLVAGTVHSIE